MKLAKLVYISLCTRVVVDDTSTDEQIIEVAKDRFIDKINTEFHENLEEIVDDIECPFDEDMDIEPISSIEPIVEKPISYNQLREWLGDDANDTTALITTLHELLTGSYELSTFKSDVGKYEIDENE